MRIGVPKEVKDREHRVALTPNGARQLIGCGHEENQEWGFLPVAGEVTGQTSF